MSICETQDGILYNPSDYEEDSPSWTHETLVIVESIGLTASSITIVPVTVASIAGVEGAGDGVLVPLHHIVLWTPDVVAVVSIAVVVSISRIVARHVNKVRGSIAVAGNIAQVKLVGKVLLIQWQLMIEPKVRFPLQSVCC